VFKSRLYPPSQKAHSLTASPKFYAFSVIYVWQSSENAGYAFCFTLFAQKIFFKFLRMLKYFSGLLKLT
jgi:hypothetical protein